MSVIQLTAFVAGYMVILATPGPNIFAVAGMASVRGLRGTMPFCFGLALGGGALCATMALAAHADFKPDRIMRIVAAGLLIWVAMGLARGRARDSAGGRSRAFAVFGAGFATAATSPLSAAYFLSSALEAGSQRAVQIAPLMVVLTACAFYLLVAGALATSAARRIMLRWDRPIRLTATAIITTMAVRMAWPLFMGA